MKPFTLTLSANDVGDVMFALKRGLFLAEQAVKNGANGADVVVRQIKSAVAIMNRPMDGGYETSTERAAAYMQSVADDCAKYGCD